MPEIPQFNAQGTVEPNNIGMEAASQAGRRIGAFYHQMGEDTGGTIAALGQQYQQHVARQEISQFQAQAATTQLGLTKTWSGLVTNSDPNDRGIADRFTSTLDDAFDGLKANLSTPQAKEYADQEIARMRQHFYEKTAADMTLRDGAAAVQNLDTMTNAGSDGVLQDASMFDTTAGMYDNALAAIIKNHPNLDEQQVAQLQMHLQDKKGDLAKAAIIGTGMRDPAAGAAMLDDKKFDQYLDSDQKKSIGLFLQEHADHLQAEQRIQEAQQHKQEIEQADKAAVEAGSLITVDQSGNYVAQPGAAEAITKYEALPGASHGTAEALKANLVRAQKQEKDVADDPTVYSNLTARIGDKTNAPITKDEVIGYQARGLLSAKSADMFLKATDKPPMDPLTQHVWETGKQTVDMFINTYIAPKDPSGNYKNPDQARNAAAFQAMFNGLWDQTVGNGTMTPDQFLQTSLNPASPAYLGHYVGRFQVGKGTIGQRTQAQTQQMISGQPPAIPADKAAKLNAQAASILGHQ